MVLMCATLPGGSRGATMVSCASLSVNIVFRVMNRIPPRPWPGVPTIPRLNPTASLVASVSGDGVAGHVLELLLMRQVGRPGTVADMGSVAGRGLAVLCGRGRWGLCKRQSRAQHESRRGGANDDV